MKNKFIIPTLLSALVAGSSLAAELEIGKQIKPLAINGQALEERNVVLTAGTHQFVGRYSYLVKKSSSQKRYQSEPYVFTFTVTKDEKVSITAPKFSRYDRAEYAFNNDDVDWEFVDSAGKPVSFETDILPKPQGSLLFRDFEKEVANYNEANNIQISENGLVTASTVAVKVVDKQDSVTADNLEQLQAWYLKASTQERKEFRKWMIDID